MKPIKIGGFHAINHGPSKNSCNMQEVSISNTKEVRNVLSTLQYVYLDPRKKPTKNKIFLLIGTKTQYIKLSATLTERPWFIKPNGDMYKNYRYD